MVCVRAVLWWSAFDRPPPPLVLVAPALSTRSAPVSATTSYILANQIYTIGKAEVQTFFQIQTQDAYNNTYSTGGADVRSPLACRERTGVKREPISQRFPRRAMEGEEGGGRVGPGPGRACSHRFAVRARDRSARDRQRERHVHGHLHACGGR